MADETNDPDAQASLDYLNEFEYKRNLVMTNDFLVSVPVAEMAHLRRVEEQARALINASSWVTGVTGSVPEMIEAFEALARTLGIEPRSIVVEVVSGHDD